jgi:hypothetical protein
VVKKAVAKGNIGIPEIKAALALLKLTGSVAAATEALAAAQEIREIVQGRTPPSISSVRRCPQPERSGRIQAYALRIN